MIAIHTVNGTKYFGVYDNAGTWTQSDGVNLATALAVLDSIPTIAGSYDGTVYEDTDTYYEADYTFNVTFSPVDESRVTADFLPVEFQATGVGVAEPTDYSTTNRTKPVATATDTSLNGKTVVGISTHGDGYDGCTVFICSDGTLHGCGTNITYQIGDGTNSARRKPVATIMP